MSGAVAVLEAARSAGVTIAVAESVTGGALAASITSIPGASEVFVGGVVAYTAALKADVLGVPVSLIAEHGVVSEQVALAMARGVANLMGAGAAVATTGVAGPGAHGGQPPGRVCIAAVGPQREATSTLEIDGSRDEVIEGAGSAALQQLCDVLYTPGGREQR